MPSVKLDHAVVAVLDWRRSNAFYRDVSGPSSFRSEKAGRTALETHNSISTVPGSNGTPVARLPVETRRERLCFEWPGPIGEAEAHLEAAAGGRGAGTRAALRRARNGDERYFRDPTARWLELISYA